MNYEEIEAGKMEFLKGFVNAMDKIEFVKSVALPTVTAQDVKICSTCGEYER